MTPASTRRPPKGILDPALRYRPSHATDVRETFERVRRELAEAPAVKVVRMPQKESR